MTLCLSIRGFTETGDEKNLTINSDHRQQVARKSEAVMVMDWVIVTSGLVSHTASEV